MRLLTGLVEINRYPLPTMPTACSPGASLERQEDRLPSPEVESTPSGARSGVPPNLPQTEGSGQVRHRM